MQILYLVSFALILISLSTFGIREDNEAVVFEAGATAAQMSMYHAAAVDMCQKTACGSGVINPTPYLHPQIAAGNLHSRGLFVTRYDAATKTVLTYMNGGYALRGSVTFGTVIAAIRDLQPGETSSVGKWDRQAGRVVPSYSRGYAVSYAVPTSIRSAVPNGSPVFVNHL